MSLLTALLGLPKITENTAIAIVLKHEGQSVSTYMPVITDKEPGSVKVTLLFPSYQGFQNRSVSFLSENAVAFIPSKGLLSNRCIKAIDYFDYKKVRKIEEFVKSEGAVTFLMEQPKRAIEFFKGLNYFRKEFPCAVAWGGQPGGYKYTEIEDDSLTLAITVYDLMYAIPIYNRKKAQGMAFSMSLIWPKTSEKIGRLALLYEIHFVVNSHSDNVLHVDGVKIRDKSFVSDLSVAQCINYVDDEIGRKAKLLKANK